MDTTFVIGYVEIESDVWGAVIGPILMAIDGILWAIITLAQHAWPLVIIVTILYRLAKYVIYGMLWFSWQ